MNLKRPWRRSAKALSLLDAQMESYMQWHAESTTAARSYRDWKSAPANDRADAFGAYLAALAREERAAGDYRRTLERIAAR